MKITERQLRQIVREVITEEQINEGLKDSTIMTTAAVILAAAGMWSAITGNQSDIKTAQEHINKPAVQKAINPKQLDQFKKASGYNPGVEMTTILNQ